MNTFKIVKCVHIIIFHPKLHLSETPYRNKKQYYAVTKVVNLKKAYVALSKCSIKYFVMNPPNLKINKIFD